MHSPPAETPPEGAPRKTRLDRELEEILSKNENIRLLPPPPTAPKRKPTRTTTGKSIPSMIPSKAQALLASPIVLALGLAIVALLVSDVSPLLANLLGLAAVACILVPMAQRFRRRPSAPPETRMWRGQVIDAKPPQPPSPLDAARDWWRSRQR